METELQFYCNFFIKIYNKIIFLLYNCFVLKNIQPTILLFNFTKIYYFLHVLYYSIYFFEFASVSMSKSKFSKVPISTQKKVKRKDFSIKINKLTDIYIFL